MNLGNLLPILDSVGEESFIDKIAKELNTIGQKLIPNFFSFLVQLLALVFMIIIVMFVAYKPVKKTLEARSAAIEKEINATKENNTISEQNRDQSFQIISDARRKSAQIISAAQNIAEIEKARIIQEGENTVIKMKQDAEEEILKAKEEAQAEVREEIVNVALDASKQILQREISEEDNSRIVEDFIKEID